MRNFSLILGWFFGGFLIFVCLFFGFGCGFFCWCLVFFSAEKLKILSSFMAVFWSECLLLERILEWCPWATGGVEAAKHHWPWLSLFLFSLCLHLFKTHCLGHKIALQKISSQKNFWFSPWYEKEGGCLRKQNKIGKCKTVAFSGEEKENQASQEICCLLTNK